MQNINHIKFPSGRSISNCLKDAKKTAKENKIPLHLAQALTAKENGLDMSWSEAIKILTQNLYNEIEFTFPESPQIFKLTKEKPFGLIYGIPGSGKYGICQHLVKQALNLGNKVTIVAPYKEKIEEHTAKSIIEHPKSNFCNLTENNVLKNFISNRFNEETTSEKMQDIIVEFTKIFESIPLNSLVLFDEIFRIAPTKGEVKKFTEQFYNMLIRFSQTKNLKFLITSQCFDFINPKNYENKLSFSAVSGKSELLISKEELDVFGDKIKNLNNFEYLTQSHSLEPVKFNWNNKIFS